MDVLPIEESFQIPFVPTFFPNMFFGKLLNWISDLSKDSTEIVFGRHILWLFYNNFVFEIFNTINYNIENWVWSLGSSYRHSVLHAVRLLHHWRTVSSSGGSPQQTCHSADVDVQHPTVLASRWLGLQEWAKFSIPSVLLFHTQNCIFFQKIYTQFKVTWSFLGHRIVVFQKCKHYYYCNYQDKN